MTSQTSDQVAITMQGQEFLADEVDHRCSFSLAKFHDEAQARAFAAAVQATGRRYCGGINDGYLMGEVYPGGWVRGSGEDARGRYWTITY